MKKILSAFMIPCAAVSLLHAESESISPLPDPTSIRFTPPPPPKEVPPMLVKGSASKNFGTHHITILRSDASTLPDIPVPPVREIGVSVQILTKLMSSLASLHAKEPAT